MQITLTPQQKITIAVTKDTEDEFYEVIPLQITNTAAYRFFALSSILSINSFISFVSLSM
jgi:hypothetical protein